MIRPPLFPPTAPPHVPRHLLPPMRAMYGVAAAFAAVPGVRLAAQLIPLDPLGSAWRYEAYGHLTSSMLAPVGALVLTQWVAGLLEHRRVQYAAAAAAVAGGALLVLGAPIFAVDYLRLRGTAPSEMRGAIDGVAWRALIQGLAMGPALVWFGLAAIRAALTPAPGQIRKPGGSGGLVVGQRAEEDAPH
jgi:hypothetical protein